MGARRRTWASDHGWWAAAIGASAQMLVTTLQILKQPGQTYLLALAAILPVHFLPLVEGFGDKRHMDNALVGVSRLLIGIGFFLSIVQTLGVHERRIRIAALTEAEIGQLVTGPRRTSSFSGDTVRRPVVTAFGSGIPMWAVCSRKRFGGSALSNGSSMFGTSPRNSLRGWRLLPRPRAGTSGPFWREA